MAETTPLRQGDTVRFVSPASTPDRNAVTVQGQTFQSWGLSVEIAPHAFDRQGFLAGTDGDRLSDLNDAFRDPKVRAVITTRGGKGSYRIAHLLDFDAIRRDPKPLIGFSDITALHLSIWKNAGVPCVHGALTEDETGRLSPSAAESLRRILMSRDPVILHSAADDPTAALTTSGKACGPLIGGNLDMIATTAGWALPPLNGAILLIEAVGLHPGQMDRPLTMLRQAGHLKGVAGLAIGRFTDCPPGREGSQIEMLRQHFMALGVPILGGLPCGHGPHALSVPLGEMAILDADAGTVSVRGEDPAGFDFQ
ncbi:LD-carboxypeptidase [Hwanghaeella grinnelliae]|uniref:LD-carboxypeptidase n=1 Tax=Hwanghaeella grinnelliae TaxID=2500179 RepID=A0A3S2VRB3_9PROT|nr:LD-carboxypeptidase [Hwanghaeella grinnelliae]